MNVTRSQVICINAYETLYLASRHFDRESVTDKRNWPLQKEGKGGVDEKEGGGGKTSLQTLTNKRDFNKH